MFTQVARFFSIFCPLNKEAMPGTIPAPQNVVFPIPEVFASSQLVSAAPERVRPNFSFYLGFSRMEKKSFYGQLGTLSQGILSTTLWPV